MDIKTIRKRIDIENVRTYLDSHIWHLAGILFLLIMTILIHNAEVVRRAAMGYEPTWGGEILILPVGILGYYLVKSAKGSIEEFRGNDWYA